MHVLISEARGTEFIHWIHALDPRISAIGIRPVSIGRQNNHSGDFPGRNILVNSTPLAAVAIPGIFRSRFDLRSKRNVGADHRKSRRLLRKSRLEPLHLGGSKHRRVPSFLGRFTIIASIDHDEPHFTNLEIKPAPGQLFTTSIIRVVVILLEDSPDLTLPRGLINSRPAPSIISCKIVVIPDSINRNFCG